MSYLSNFFTNEYGKKTFNGYVGSNGNLAIKFNNAVEPVTISGSTLTGTVNFDLVTQSILYYTANAGGNWTLNFRGDSTLSLNNALATGESITAVVITTQGATAYYNNVVQIDGSSVTPKYQGGTAWTAGFASSLNVYTYTIIKTASATYTVLASLSKF